MDGQHGIDRGRLAAAATMLIPGEHPFAEPGEMFPVSPFPVVATLAETADIYGCRTAAAEEHPLPHTGKPDGTGHFPSLPWFAFPARGGDAGRIFRSLLRQKQVMGCRNLEQSADGRLQARRNGRCSQEISLSGNHPQQLTLLLVIFHINVNGMNSISIHSCPLANCIAGVSLASAVKTGRSRSPSSRRNINQS
jgi:hypothetical protein